MCSAEDVLQSSYSSADVIVSSLYSYGDNSLGNGVRTFASEMTEIGKTEGYLLGTQDTLNKMKFKEIKDISIILGGIGLLFFVTTVPGKIKTYLK